MGDRQGKVGIFHGAAERKPAAAAAVTEKERQGLEGGEKKEVQIQICLLVQRRAGDSSIQEQLGR